MNTFVLKGKDIKKKWCVVDAKDMILGRVATEIASILRGKNKVEFTPHLDTGDNVIVINASKIRLTGKKWKDKKYYRHTGYPGGIRCVTAEKMMENKPEDLITHAVKGMLPKNILGSHLLKNLRVYAGNEHPHKAQEPVEV